MRFAVVSASLSLVLRTLLHTFGPSYAALFNEEYAFSLGFAATLLISRGAERRSRTRRRYL